MPADARRASFDERKTGPAICSALRADFTGVTPDISSYDALAEMDAAKWHELAAAAAEKLFANETLPTPAVSENPCDTSMTLECGLYLVIAHSGGMTKDEYVKREGGTLVGTIARSDEYEYTYAPELISLPASAEAIPAALTSDGASTEPPSYTTSGGHWFYTVSAMLKPTEELRYGDLVIEKDLVKYETSSPVSFVFRVQVSRTDDDGNVFGYDDYHMITFSAAEKKSLTLTELFPVGSTVTVTEVYAGAGYKLTGTEWSNLPTDGEYAGQHVIKPKDTDVLPLTVTFTNEYDGKLLQGGGILNEYEFEKLNADDPGEWKLNAPTAFPANP